MSDLDALLRERAGYARRGLSDRVAACDAEIKRLGGSVPEPVVDAPVAPQGKVPKSARKQTKR